MYQQPSSTTLYYSYLGMPALIEIRLRNEAREITDITFLPHQRVSFVLRLRQSFPEDCARLKLSSARASQAGLKEMMMQMKNEGVSEQWSKETTCTTRTNSSYMWREIADDPSVKCYNT